MTDRFTDAFLDEVRASISINSVVGQHVQWDEKKSSPGRRDRWAIQGGGGRGRGAQQRDRHLPEAHHHRLDQRRLGAPAGLPTHATVAAAKRDGSQGQVRPQCLCRRLVRCVLPILGRHIDRQRRATNLTVKVVTQQGTFALSISQQVGGGDNSNGGRWEFLGRFKLRYGIPSLDQLHLVNSPLAV